MPTVKKAPAKKKAVAKRPVKKAAAPKSKGLTAYSIAQRKSVPIKDAVITKSKGKFVAKGNDGKGHNVQAFLGKDAAHTAVTSGQARKQGRW